MSGRKAVPASSTARGDLPLPLTAILVDPVNERQVSRVWRNIAVRRAVAGGQVGLALRWAFVGALLGTLVTLGIVTASSTAPVPVAVQAPANVGPLKLADGRPLEALEVVASSPAASTPLSDGSVIRVEPEARVEPLAASETQLVLRLVRGRAHFDVRPGGFRRWLVEAGLATVEVIGTEFTVDRSPERVRVEVGQGLVLVRGNTLPDGVVRLGAGHSVEVRAAPEVLPLDTQPTTENSTRSRGAASAGRWREALTGGGYRDAYAVLGAEGLAREAQRSESADDLFDLADVARLSGHPAGAVIPLERLLSLHPGSARAPVAALTLGRIRLELKNPRAAAASLEQALRLGVPQGLEEDAFVRLVQAHAESGNRAEANRVFEVYTRRYPNGRRSLEARSWLLR